MTRPHLTAAGLAYDPDFPRIEAPGGRLIDAPHPEWVSHEIRWRWLLDSWEGGEIYRDASYGIDPGGMPLRNMIRHKREYPAPGDEAYGPYGPPDGSDAYANVTDDYEMRRARTPVPTFFAEALDAHFDAIFEQEIARDGPKELEAFWADVDGRGTDMAEWWGGLAARLVGVLANLDVIVDYPPAPPGVEIATRKHQEKYGLDRPVMSYILPENVAWWTLNRMGEYTEILVREVQDGGGWTWRYWNAEVWQLFGADGHKLGDPFEHGHGFIPIIRLFDGRRPRCKHIGLPRYEPIAELMREYYNRDSELVLSDSTAAHPLLQGPDDYVTPDGKVFVGPGLLLPMKGNDGGGGGKTYQGFAYVDPPKGAADSIRQNLGMMRDAVDRAAKMTKPAGSPGTTGATVSQSGISKIMDEQGGMRLLGKLSKMMARNEEAIARLALRVIRGPKGQPPRPDEIRISYPSRFNLVDAAGQIDALGRLQLVAASAGELPQIESAALKRIARELLKGMPDEEYRVFDDEIDAFMAARLAAPPTPAPTSGGAPPGSTTPPAGTQAPDDESGL